MPSAMSGNFACPELRQRTAVQLGEANPEPVCPARTGPQHHNLTGAAIVSAGTAERRH
jgi:hypothetical protein